MGRRDERREERRNLLLDSAMEILAEGGVEALTIPRLAQRMDASVGGLYRYFPSKEAIFVALQERAIDAFATLQEDAIARADRRAAEATPAIQSLARVIAAFHALLDLATEAPTQHALVDAFLSAPSPTLSDAQARDIEAYLTPVLTRCAAQLETASASGALSVADGMVRTHLLWAALHGLSHFRKRDRIQPDTLRVSALAPALLEGLLVGWGASHTEVQSALVLAGVSS
jgi:AcrR family transcriptional regulator